MSSPSVINLLIIDRSRSDIDHIVQTLRGDGYQIEPLNTDQTETARNAIEYQPMDMILLRMAENLPTLAEVRSMVTEAEQDIPIIAVMDDASRVHYRPARLLNDGADNFFHLDDADHLVAVVRTELRHLQARKRERSFEIRFKEGEIRTQALLKTSRRPSPIFTRVSTPTPIPPISGCSVTKPRTSWPRSNWFTWCHQVTGTR